MRERLYTKLVVWQEAHALCTQIYKITNNFPSHEKYSLVNQVRRSAYSVPTNLAEGNTRRSKKEKLRYIEIAEASLEEIHYQLLLSLELQYLSKVVHEELDNHIQRVGYLLHKLRMSLQK